MYSIVAPNFILNCNDKADLKEQLLIKCKELGIETNAQSLMENEIYIRKELEENEVDKLLKEKEYSFISTCSIDYDDFAVGLSVSTFAKDNFSTSKEIRAKLLEEIANFFSQELTEIEELLKLNNSSLAKDRS